MRIALAAVVVALAAAAAYAQQGQQFVAYQKALLARAVPPAVQSYCSPRFGSSGPDYDACRVTRLFLSDLAAGRAQGYPPMADIKYTSTQAEQDAIVAAVQKYLQ